MKILGGKFWGQDSALCVLDFDKNKIFCLSTDRVSRIKKDNHDVSEILDNFKDEFIEPDLITSPFKTFDGKDTTFENKGTSYFWLNFQKILRKIEKPKYYSDINKKRSLLYKLILFFKLIPKFKFFYYFCFWKFYMKRLLADLPFKNDFHFKYCNKYILDILKSINLKNKEINFFDHHTSHAASAYYLSDFYNNNEASYVMTLDQQGDHAFNSLFYFDNYKIEELNRSLTKKVKFDNIFQVVSIATVYSLFTMALGYRENCDEGKVEALAAYGNPDKTVLKELDEIIFISIDNGKVVFNSNPKKFSDLLNSKNLKSLLNQIGPENFCSTIQYWLENIVVDYLNIALPKNKKVNLCLAGGVFANVILNYKIYEKCRVEKLYVCPPMGDEGSALGSAILGAIEKKIDLKKIFNHNMPYWGPSYNREETLKVLNNNKDKIKFVDCGNSWSKKASEKILENKIISIFQGRMEFGPRALGNRSILANVVDPDMKEKINLFIKKRPKFQPFCPAVLEEDREELFINSYKHKYMATAFLMKEEFRNKYPSAVHIDGTARPQFIEKNDNEHLFNLLKCLKKELKHGIVINTSFNLHGRSMVMKPQDAVDDLLSCDLDFLYLNGYEVKKLKNN